MPEPTIRRAGPGDADALAVLGARTFTEAFGHLYSRQDLRAFLAQAYDPAQISADLADPRKAAWLVEGGGAAMGYAFAGPCDLPHAGVTPDCGELKRLYFLRDYQGGGIGGRLFDLVLDWLQGHGPRDVWIGVWSGNAGAQRFYARRGFRPVGDYGFRVGETVDREIILHRSAQSFSSNGTQLAKI